MASIGGFEVLGPLHQGAHAAVYRAKQDGQVVALKVLGTTENPILVQRFLNEASVLRLCDHENIVRLIASGEDQGTLFLALECVEGPSLTKAIRKRAFTHRENAAIAMRIARALHHVHGRGVVHADIAPGNILLGSDGTPKLIDFGIAHGRDLASVPLAPGTTAGTPIYMSPEQATGRVDLLDPRTDVYSLGAVLYESVTGRAPFRGSSTLEILKRVTETEPVRPRAVDPSIHPGLEVCILRAMDKDLDRRYGSAEELADDLQGWIRAVPDWFSIVPYS